MNCSEIMTPDPKMCVPADKVTQVIGLMWDFDCGGIPVVTDMESKELVGMVTDRDIGIHVVKHALAHPSEVTVGECMSAPASACQEDHPVEEALQIMAEMRIRRLPILDKNAKCIGIISVADVLHHIDSLGLKQVITMLQAIAGPHEGKIPEPESKKKTARSKEGK